MLFWIWTQKCICTCKLCIHLYEVTTIILLLLCHFSILKSFSPVTIFYIPNSKFQGPELLSKYIGQSEQSVRDLFARFLIFNLYYFNFKIVIWCVLVTRMILVLFTNICVFPGLDVPNRVWSFSTNLTPWLQSKSQLLRFTKLITRLE